MWGGREVADGVDATVDPEQSACSKPTIDRVLAYPRTEELRARDDAVLRGGDVRDRQIRGCGELSADSAVKWTHP